MMNTKPPTSFISTFTPRKSIGCYLAAVPPTCPGKCRTTIMPRMVAPKHVRRTEEIERLTKQLEELRAKREQILSNRKNNSQSQSAIPTDAKKSSSAPSLPSTSPVSVNPPTEHESTFQLGKHAEESHFMSISSVESEEYHPRILLIAGAVPGLTTETFKTTPQILYSKEPAKGNLLLSRLPDGYTGDFVSMPTFDVLAKCGDPVAILAEPAQFSATKLPSNPDDDVVLVVDRDLSDYPFQRSEFYAWDVNGRVQIGWSDNEPPADVAKRIGKVVYGHIEIDRELRSKKSCWEEENETYT